MKKHTLFLALFLLLLPATARAQEMSFGWPANCTPGTDCWVINHMDHDPAPRSIADYNCGGLTYDGHDGTDIGIADRSVQVDVLAAADGVVKKTRNDQRDHDGGRQNTEPSRLTRTECGNTVLLEHGNGWRSFYCHMREGSVTVQEGQTVSKGEKLGEIGQSGLADFPHVHLEILKGKDSIDPFSGDGLNDACGTGGAGLWDTPVGYDPVMLYASGFATATPVYETMVKQVQSPQHIASNAPFLFFWFLGIGAEAGDKMRLEIREPSGRLIAQSDALQPRRQIRMMRYVGIPNKARLRKGLYRGSALLVRTLPNGETIERTIEQSVLVN